MPVTSGPSGEPTYEPMVEMQSDPTSNAIRFVICPNQSLSWDGNRRFLLAMAAVSFGIAGALSAMGFWPILPFAGLEMAALAGALYCCSRRTARCEVVEVGDTHIRVESGRRRPERSWDLQRMWAQVILDPATFRGHPTRLRLRSAGTQVEVGRDLTNEEREGLARDLRRALEAGGAA